jgi:hypothetical protein
VFDSDLTDAVVTRLDGDAPELEVALDLAKRALPVAPVFLLVSGLFWGLGGVASAAVAIALVVANFLLAARIMAVAAKISLAFLYGAILGGYVLRLALLMAAFFAVKGFGWFEVIPFGFTLVITHLGLLVWETKYVSISLAYPGLKPERAS